MKMFDEEGTWWLTSESDPRWKNWGKAGCGGFAMPSECKDALERLKKLYGEPPKDLEWGYMKD